MESPSDPRTDPYFLIAALLFLQVQFARQCACFWVQFRLDFLPRKSVHAGIEKPLNSPADSCLPGYMPGLSRW